MCEEKRAVTEEITPKRHREIKSFVRREGRLTRGQERILSESPYLIDHSAVGKIWDLDQLFSRKGARRTLEIGYGDGASFVEMAQAAPEEDFLGLEVHRPGVGRMLLEVERLGLTNIRTIDYDAVKIIDEALPEASIDRVQIFFPDPWHKKRHNKRRIIQPEFIKKLARIIPKGGQVCLATDWEPYAEHMMEVMSASPDFKNSVDGFILNQTHRPTTKYERRGLRLGHGVWDLVFIRQ